MQVGDLVRHRNHPITGIVLEVHEEKGETLRQYRCLWSDGDSDCWVVYWLVIPCK